MRTLLLFLLSFLGLTQSPAPSPAPGLLPPVSEFNTRITKKPFGLYVTPKNSPVSPEKFTGYHTGVDVEYQDVSGEVSVNSIYSGQITYSGWVSGYGGVIAQKINFKNSDYTVLYGHLSPDSLLPVGTQVSSGQKVGILGKGYSKETDGERRHLHLSIINGSKLDLRGYVKNKSDLSLWTNPLDLIH